MNYYTQRKRLTRHFAPPPVPYRINPTTTALAQRLYAAGYTLASIAYLMGVSAGAARRWVML